MMNKMLMFRCDKMGIFANNYHFYYIYGLSAMSKVALTKKPMTMPILSARAKQRFLFVGRANIKRKRQKNGGKKKLEVM
jgi:hypothetical protein